ncbi:MAG: SH3 domain-containing protein [bacterium]
MNDRINSKRPAKVITAYRTPYPKGFRISQNTTVTLTDRECEYPGWIWCRVIGNHAGWIPESYLQSTTDDQAILIRDYDSTELSVDQGAVVSVLWIERHWAWCRTADNAEGWLPMKTLDIENE